MAARRHMHEYGTTLEQLAEVAVQARANAAANPDAMFRDPITVDEVLDGPMIADPFTKLHCCIRSDGGCAVLLAAEDYVPDTAKAPVWILGTGRARLAHHDVGVGGLHRLPGGGLGPARLRAGGRAPRPTSISPRSTTPSPT